MPRPMRLLRALALLCLCVAPSLHAQTDTVTVNGVVLDPSGAAIPGATLHLKSTTAQTETTTDDIGRFTLTASPATYSLAVEAQGFRPYTNPTLALSAHSPALTVTLQIATTQDEVNVSSDSGLSTDSSSNKSALIFKDDTLDTFSDDPAVMQQQLEALGGIDPTDPPQIFVDGFSGGVLPPKNTIREIRINQNPFSAQYDQFGSSRIEVFTKPGTNKLHGGVDLVATSSALSSPNPYTTGPQPSYSISFLNANLNGPLGNKSSFFLSATRNSVASNAIVNATTSTTVNISEAVPNPTLMQTYSARIDRQLSPADTFIGRYTFMGNTQTNPSVGLLTLPSQGSFSNTHTQTLQLTDTHLFGAKVVLDAALQYTRTRLNQDAASSAPTLIVQGAFNGGGNPSQSLHDDQDRLELQSYFSIAHGTHFIRTGLRYRLLRDANLTTAGYNGQYTFANLAAYQAGTPSQFSLAAGTPSATVLSGDIGLYAEEEWKTAPNLTLTYGLRFENESAIPANIDVAPRLAFAWSIHPNKKTKQAAFVLRGGTGVFYSRFPSANILQSIRQNGVTQQVYLDSNAPSYPNFPTSSQLAATPPTIYRINPHLHSPTTLQSNITLEHSFGKIGTIAANAYLRRSIHLFESLNINAPLPGTYNPANPLSGIRPFGGSQNIYEFSSDGIANGHTLTVNANINASKKISFFAFLGIGHQETDANGPSSFASNTYNLGADAGRPAGYSPRQLYTGINAKPGLDTSVNIFLAARSSSAFNITTGTDLNGDTQFNDRPAFATDLTRPSVVRTAFGNFDTAPIPGQTIIPINYGDAPALVYTELYAAKNIRFGPTADAPSGPPSTPGGKAPPPVPRYRIQLGVEVDNPLNHVNGGAPIGVLNSNYFGRSISINPQFSSGTSGNRNIYFRGSFSF